MVPLPLPLDGDGLDGRAPLRTPTTGRPSAAGVGEMLRWAARAPHEVPLLNGEFFFIAALAE